MRVVPARKALPHEADERARPTGQSTRHGQLDGPARSATDVVALQRTAGNRAAAAAVARSADPVQRQVAAPGPMTRSEFLALMRSRYAISTVRAGTFADQQEVNRRPGVATGGGLAESAWAAWDPGESSEIYQS